MSDSVRRAVAIGGGTGLPKVLRCLLDLGYSTTAVVTMADDGGSSGLLRRELGMLPPGDARNCLVGMAPDPHAPLAEAFSYRFDKGEGLRGHSLGNLIITALTDIEGSFPAALDAAGRMLGSQGRVLPSTLDDVVLTAEDIHGSRVVGQRNVAESAAPILRVRFDSDRGAALYPPAAAAIAEADVIVIGPGSLFTSILPNFLVSGMTDAVRSARAEVIYVCNLANQRGETTGMDAAQHVDALIRHGLADCVDVALLHDSTVHPIDATVDAVEADGNAVAAIAATGIRPILADMVDPEEPRHHSSQRILEVLRKVAP